MTQKEQEFKKELKALLRKYDADIGADVGAWSDMNGIYGEKLVVDFHERNERGIRVQTGQTVLCSNGWYVNESDL